MVSRKVRQRYGFICLEGLTFKGLFIIEFDNSWSLVGYNIKAF